MKKILFVLVAFCYLEANASVAVDIPCKVRNLDAPASSVSNLRYDVFLHDKIVHPVMNERGETFTYSYLSFAPITSSGEIVFTLKASPRNVGEGQNGVIAFDQIKINRSNSNKWHELQINYALSSDDKEETHLFYYRLKVSCNFKDYFKYTKHWDVN